MKNIGIMLLAGAIALWMMIFTLLLTNAFAQELQSLGWVNARYVYCYAPDGQDCVIHAPGADGANVREVPVAPPFVALANYVPVVVLSVEQDWVLITPGCPLAPIWGGAFSITAGVPMLTCGF